MALLIASARRGHERAVLRDLLDALFPYDTGVRGFVEGWSVYVETALGLEEVRRYLELLPIRNLVSVRYVLAELEAARAAELPRELPGIVEKAGVKVSRLRVRLTSRSGWSQSMYPALVGSLRERGLLDPSGYLLAVEERGGKVLVSVVLRRWPRRRG